MNKKEAIKKFTKAHEHFFALENRLDTTEYRIRAARKSRDNALRLINEDLKELPLTEAGANRTFVKDSMSSL
jgi:hypothetical protein